MHFHLKISHFIISKDITSAYSIKKYHNNALKPVGSALKNIRSCDPVLLYVFNVQIILFK